jgi:hypothetical protein
MSQVPKKQPIIISTFGLAGAGVLGMIEFESSGFVRTDL